MEFWKDNRVDARFEMPVSEVASQYLAWARSEGVEADHLRGMPVERSLRWWLTSSEHFSSVWVAEAGDESFSQLMNLVLDKIWDEPPC